MDIVYQELDLLALMPCPLKVPLEKVISEEIQSIQKETGVGLKYSINSNAVMQEDIFVDIAAKNSIDELPNIMLAPGISRFFYEDFSEKFRKTGCFQCVGGSDVSMDYRSLEICDPKGYYDMTAFNPLVFLVDKTNEPDLPEPECWQDLINPCYEKKIAFRGKDDRSFCEGVLLSIYTSVGKVGIEKLARSVKCRLHPAEMAKLAGTKGTDTPFISVIPLSFAKMALAKNRPGVKIVWPSDGAVVNPIVMLVKKDCPPPLKRLAEFLTSERVTSIYEDIGFYSLRSRFSDISESCTYKWFGWDFIEDNPMNRLLSELNEIMFRVIQEEKQKNLV